MSKIKEAIFGDLDGTIIDKNYSFVKAKKAKQKRYEWHVYKQVELNSDNED